jgi:uncharacterized protein (TIGR03083 family)
MSPAPMTEAVVREATTAERRELCQVLEDLSLDDWNAPSLCAGWRVRDVVAHMTMPFRYSKSKFISELVRDRGNFNRMADRCARRDAAASTIDLVASMRDNVSNPWRPPGGGFEGALVHDVIHGLDITVSLGIDRHVPEERLRMVLDSVTRPKTLRYFAVDLSGVELRASDLDWSFGSGSVTVGLAQDLALLLCGRELPVGGERAMPKNQSER